MYLAVFFISCRKFCSPWSPLRKFISWNDVCFCRECTVASLASTFDVFFFSPSHTLFNKIRCERAVCVQLMNNCIVSSCHVGSQMHICCY